MTRFATTHTAVNLLRCSGWELINSDGTAAFWSFANLNGVNRGTLSDNKLAVVLASNEVSSISQNFGTISSDFDFTPSDASAYYGVYPTVPSGYAVTRRIPLARDEHYTFSFDLDQTVGGSQFRIVWTAEPLNSSSAEIEHTTPWQVLGKPTTSRVHIRFDAERALTDIRPISDVRVEFQRAEGVNLANLTISKLMLVPGDYSNLPYTGDPMISCIPAGAIIMTIGPACPAGFEELGNDGASALAEWTTNDPSRQARFGNFPRSATDASGTVLHAPTTNIDGGTGDNGLYETENGFLADNYTKAQGETLENHIFTSSEANPLADTPGSHIHEMTSEKTEPLAVVLRFCKRL